MYPLLPPQVSGDISGVPSEFSTSPLLGAAPLNITGADVDIILTEGGEVVAPSLSGRRRLSWRSGLQQEEGNVVLGAAAGDVRTAVEAGGRRQLVQQRR